MAKPWTLINFMVIQIKKIRKPYCKRESDLFMKNF